MAKLSDPDATLTELSGHNPTINYTSVENTTDDTEPTKKEEPPKPVGLLPLKKRFSNSHWENYMKAQPLEQDATIAYDFAFVMKPVKVLKDAFKVLSDQRFNPRQNAVIQVGQQGCEIIVSTFDINTEREAFGYLGLKATAVDEFQCSKSIRKSFSLRRLLKFLETSEKWKNDSVFVSSVQGTNHLSFQFGSNALDVSLGLPISTSCIDIKDVDPTTEHFPNCISYGFEAVIRSSHLRIMSVKLHEQKYLVPCSETVRVIVKPATIEIGAGNVITTLTSSMEDQGQEHQISTAWRYWESMESATSAADKASVYLVTGPTTSIMVRFHLEQLGDLAYLIPANFRSAVSHLPVLGHFHTLNPRHDSPTGYSCYLNRTQNSE